MTQTDRSLRSKHQHIKKNDSYISIRGYILHCTDTILTIVCGDFGFQFYKKEVIDYELPNEEREITNSTLIVLKLRRGCRLLNLHPIGFYKDLFPHRSLPFLIACRQTEQMQYSQSEHFNTLENEFINSLK
jgi:hypothetical protein